MKWLHLSDLHFSGVQNFDTKKLRGELLKYVKTIKNPKFDFIILSGDFRFAPSKPAVDVEEVVAYIRQLAEAGGTEIKNVLCVPGNHDLQRSISRRGLIQLPVEEKYQKGIFLEDVGTALQQDFCFFNRIETELHGSCPPSDKLHRLVKTKWLNFLLLNTAITAGTDSDRGRLLLGWDDIDRVLEERNYTVPTVVVGHHGVSFWDREEQKKVLSHFDDVGIHLYLCGHEHSLYGELYGDGLRQITVGCIGANDASEKVDISFEVGEYSSGKARIKYYEWKEHFGWNSVSDKIDDEIVLQKSYHTSKNSDFHKSNDLSTDAIAILNDTSISFPLRFENFRLDGQFD